MITVTLDPLRVKVAKMLITLILRSYVRAAISREGRYLIVPRLTQMIRILSALIEESFVPEVVRESVHWEPVLRELRRPVVMTLRGEDARCVIGPFDELDWVQGDRIRVQATWGDAGLEECRLLLGVVTLYPSGVFADMTHVERLLQTLNRFNSWGERMYEQPVSDVFYWVTVYDAFRQLNDLLENPGAVLVEGFDGRNFSLGALDEWGSPMTPQELWLAIPVSVRSRFVMSIEMLATEVTLSEAEEGYGQEDLTSEASTVVSDARVVHRMPRFRLMSRRRRLQQQRRRREEEEARTMRRRLRLRRDAQLARRIRGERN